MFWKVGVCFFGEVGGFSLWELGRSIRDFFFDRVEVWLGKFWVLRVYSMSGGSVFYSRWVRWVGVVF